MAGIEKTPRELRNLRWQETFAALKHYNYRLWFGGQVVSLVGTWMQSTAQGYLIYQITGPPFLSGVGGICGRRTVIVVHSLRRGDCRPPTPADAPGHYPDFHDGPGLHPGRSHFYPYRPALAYSCPGVPAGSCERLRRTCPDFHCTGAGQPR